MLLCVSVRGKNTVNATHLRTPYHTDLVNCVFCAVLSSVLAESTNLTAIVENGKTPPDVNNKLVALYKRYTRYTVLHIHAQKTTQIYFLKINGLTNHEPFGEGLTSVYTYSK